MFSLRWLITVTASIALVGGCAKHTKVESESVVDSPQYHYHAGVRYFDEGRIDEAVQEFTRAQGLDKTYAPAYAGLALVNAKAGRFLDAYRLIERGLNYDAESRTCLIAKARVITLEHRSNDWLKQVLKTLEPVLKNKPDDSETLFFRAEAYKAAHNFSAAAADYARIIENKDDWSADANAAWETVQKIVRAAPATEKGNEIALVPALSRAEFAVLLIEELRLNEILREKFSAKPSGEYQTPDVASSAQTVLEGMQHPSDIESHWARNWILETLQLRAMEVYPDVTFRPDERINRAEFAMTVQMTIARIVHDPSVMTKFYGEETHFSDVSSSHPAYNAITLCVNRGIMEANLDGTFHAAESISGADGLLMIRTLQDVLRQVF